VPKKLEVVNFEALPSKKALERSKEDISPENEINEAIWAYKVAFVDMVIETFHIFIQ